MKRVPASRYVLFGLLVGAGLFWDLYSKHVVFTDLGYRDRAANAITPVRGEHVIFDAPPQVEGESVAYLEGWMTFRLLTSFNRGALWGIGQGQTWVFASLSLVAVIGIPCWLFAFRAAISKWLTVSMSLVLAGTLGNLYDRLALHDCINLKTGEPLHAVRDFLLFTFGTFHWPVFNFADVFLVTGATMLVVQSFQAEDKASEPSSETPADTESAPAS
jgi:signal peptidase II